MAAKAAAALKHELTPIVCIGEHLEVREAGEHVSHCEKQLRGSLAGLSAEQIGNVVIAYEPVWAIGTGRVASAADAQEVCAAIRKELGVAGLAAGRRHRAGALRRLGERQEHRRHRRPETMSTAALVGGASLDGEQFATLAAIAAGGPLP